MDSKPLLSSPSQTPTNPLIIISSSSTTTSARGFLVRAVTIVALLAVSLWANYEASKGFQLTIRNAPSSTLAGRRFDLMFVSNGKAAKMLLESSNAVERILYPRHMYVKKKPVSRVVLELAGEETAEMVQVKHDHKKEKPGEYLVLIKPEILEEENATVAMEAALYRAMAHMWLWDGTSSTKSRTVDAMVEYLMAQSGIDSTSSTNSSVGNFMQKCESRSQGFVARLNNAVHELRSERMADRALDQLLQELCLEHLQLASI